MNFSSIIEKVKSMTASMPDSAVRSMYDIVAHGNGERTVLRLEDGLVYMKVGDGYRQMDDIFSWVISRIPSAPKMVVKMAQSAMRENEVEIQGALASFCSGGKTALILFSPKSAKEPPAISVIVRDSEGRIDRWGDDQVFGVFKKMLSQA